MTSCLGKNCSCSLLSVSIMMIYQFVCDSFLFGFECGIWDLNFFSP